jgi:glycosyltransferase involved in cell wall biosynthesis
MTEPLVNVYLPTFEPQKDLLQEALSSLQSQSESLFTCLIHDDASRVPVKEYSEPFLKDKRFSFTRSAFHRGIGGNWNACLKYGSAPFIQYLFQDDRIYANTLKTILSIFSQYEDVGFISFDHEYVCEKDISTAPLYEKLRKDKTLMLAPGPHDGLGFLRFWLQHELNPNLIGEPSFVMMRRSLVQDIGKFREDLDQFLDPRSTKNTLVLPSRRTRRVSCSY